MKKIFLLPLIALFVMAGCSDLEDPTTGINTKWVQFEKTNYQTAESKGLYRIPVLLASNTNPDGVDVTFTLESTKTDFIVSPNNGVLHIPAGEFVGYIDVTPAYDPLHEITANYTLKFKLTASDVKLGLGGENNYNTETTLTVTPTICLLDTAEFEGTYSAEDVGVESYSVTVKRVSATKLSIINLGNQNEESNTIVVLDNSDIKNPTATFPNQQFLYTDTSGETPASIYIFDQSFFGTSYVSTFDTCTKQMTLYFGMGNEEFGFFLGGIATAGNARLVHKVILTKN